jgi:FkbM family methyltransferase
MSASPAADFLGQDLDVALIRALVPHVRERFFLDVGAEKGSFATVLFDCGMRGALFDPLARHQAALDELARRHGSRAYPYAIDEADGERELFIASDERGTELDYFHSLQKLDGSAQFTHRRSARVACRSLASLVAEGELPAAVGILKTDTEGQDINVLRGMGAMRPELVVCEYFTEGLYPGWENARPSLAVDLMRSRGYARYVAIKRRGELEYCSASPTGFLPRQWGNLFFMRDDLFEAGHDAIVAFLAAAESRFVESVEAIALDRISKESVIQGLLAR